MLEDHGIMYEEVIIGKYVTYERRADSNSYSFMLSRVAVTCCSPRIPAITLTTCLYRNNISQHIIRAVANASTVPQVFMNGKLIGGSEALEKYLSSDEYKQGTKLQSK